MRSILIVCFSLLLVPGLGAAPLTEARVTKIINRVEVVEPEKGAHPAALSEVIKDQIGLRTGSKSRSELMFDDKTLTRIGPETYFSFKAGTRDLTLQQGTLLLQVPKGMGGAKIRTAAVTASITGTTIMMEYTPGKNIKVLVLEGSLRLSRNGSFGDSLLLTPGKMVIMPPNAKHIPDPVSVDLAHVMKTSSLVNMTGKGEAPLPSVALIDKEIEQQAQDKSKNNLVDTNLVILGHGTNVVLGSDEVINALNDRHNGDDTILALGPKNTPTPFPTATPAPSATPNQTPPPISDSSPTPAPGNTPTATVTPAPTSTPAPTVTPTPTATATPGDDDGGGDDDGEGDDDKKPSPTPGPAITPMPTPKLSAVAAPSPGSTLDTPPTANVAVTLSGTTTIEARQPRIKGSVNLIGSFYKGAALDGPASWFVFGNSSVYDVQRAFDSRFGVNYDQTFPTADVAVIRFGAITFAAAPLLQLNGPIDIALIGDTGISASAPFAMDLSLLGSFTLATNNGVISLNSASFTATGSTFKFLQLYQRGSSAFTFSGGVNAPNASLYLDSGGALTLGATGNITVNQAAFNSTGNMTLSGALNANFLQLTSQTSIQINSAVASPGILYAYAPSFTTTKSLAVNGGELNIGSGGISATGLDLTGFNNLITTGNLKARNVSVTGQLSVGGTFVAGITPFTLSASSIFMPNGLSAIGAAGAAGGTVTLNAASVLIASGPGAINGITLNGGDSLLGSGGNGGSLNLGTTAKPIAGDVTINAPVSATTGSNALGTGGTGGNVNVTSNGTVSVASTVKVSDSALTKSSARGGTIALTSNKTNGTAISVSSSAQLLALLSNLAPGPGGSIKLTSAGGAINVNGTVKADRGTVEMTNNGANGAVNVNNATLHGDVVKAGALGNNGTLNVGGGSIDAATTIKLYAGGSNGRVNFTNNVTLSGNSLKVIAADTVTIFNGKVVTVLGPNPANVFTNNPNYSGFGGNGTTTGTFAGKGAVTQSFGLAPGY